ncbi:MAG: AI-2E family transporter [Bacteroidetes bacterium SW_10_40_5]|nr:MAG: AI-2E family transporter [Bacteroidetes bacterium SW_10_40_5]
MPYTLVFIVSRDYCFNYTSPRAMANEYIQEKITALLSITNIGSTFNYFIGFTGDFFIGFFSVSFITFFFLKDSGMGKEIVEASVPNYYVEQALHTLQKIEYLLSRYFTGLLFQIIGITLLAYVGLSLVGIKHALLIAFFAGVVNIIPYIGPLMGSGFAILVLISTNLDVSFTDVILPMIFQIIGVFMVVQVADNIIFQPIIFSSSVKAHPLEIFIVILIAARLAGITGMIVAIPAYTFLRVVAKEFLDQFKIVQSLTSQL